MNTSDAREKLTVELQAVERALNELGPRTESGWEASVGDIDTSATEADEVADRIEETEERQDEVATLSVRREEIVAALLALDNGTYGVCRVCGAPIEEERLMANPAALTCITHA